MDVDEIISYHDLVTAEKSNLQKGMNFGIGKRDSISYVHSQRRALRRRD